MNLTKIKQNIKKFDIINFSNFLQKDFFNNLKKNKEIVFLNDDQHLQKKYIKKTSAIILTKVFDKFLIFLLLDKPLNSNLFLNTDFEIVINNQKKYISFYNFLLIHPYKIEKTYNVLNQNQINLLLDNFNNNFLPKLKQINDIQNIPITNIDGQEIKKKNYDLFDIVWIPIFYLDNLVEDLTIKKTIPITFNFEKNNNQERYLKIRPVIIIAKVFDKFFVFPLHSNAWDNQKHSNTDLLIHLKEPCHISLNNGFLIDVKIIVNFVTTLSVVEQKSLILQYNKDFLPFLNLLNKPVAIKKTIHQPSTFKNINYLLSEQQLATISKQTSPIFLKKKHSLKKRFKEFINHEVFLENLKNKKIDIVHKTNETFLQDMIAMSNEALCMLVVAYKIIDIKSPIKKVFNNNEFLSQSIKLKINDVEVNAKFLYNEKFQPYGFDNYRGILLMQYEIAQMHDNDYGVILNLIKFDD